MKKILFALSLLWSCSAWAAYPTFLSFNTNDFIVSQPYISLSRTNTGGTNVFNYTTNIYENSTFIYTNTINIYTNSIITFNGTNLATINPTIGRVPYNFDGTNLYDSALYFIDTNTVGADQVFTYDLGVTNLAAGGFVVSIPTVGGYGVLTNAPFGNFALWTNVNHVYIPTDSSQIGLIANNVDSIQTLIAGGALMFSSYGTPQLALGVNDLSNEFLGYMLLYSTTATPTDTQIRLSAGNGPGQLLILQNATNNAFELLNGDTLWDDATSAVYLPGGDWKPTAKGESIMLLHNTQGWAEIGRFGGSTNVVTQELWQFAGGYLQPKTSTNPLFWTNSVTWGPGTTNSLLRLGRDLYYTNSSTAQVFFHVVDGNGNGVQIGEVGSAAQIEGGTSLQLLNKNGNGLFLGDSVVQPSSNDAISLAGPSSGTQFHDLGLSGTEYVNGFISGANYARIAIFHTGTNGAITYASQANGTAGPARPHNFTGSDVRIEGIPLGAAAMASGGGFPIMPNTSDCYYTNIFLVSQPTGTNTMFTVPANMRFNPRQVIVTSTTNSTSCVFGKITNSVEYNFASAVNVGTNNSTLGNAGYVLEAGEQAVVVSGGPLQHLMLCGLVFTNTLPLKTYALNSLSAGDNVIYTVPAGKHPTGTSASFTMQYVNQSGGPRTIKWYYVPSGLSADATTIANWAIVSDGAASATTISAMALFPGDKIIINVDAGTATQSAFISVVETP